MIGITGGPRARKLADALVSAGLFDRADGGYLVHDYLDFNPSRVVVLKKRADDAARKRQSESGVTPNGFQADSGGPRAGVPSHPIRSHPDQTKKPAAAVDARSKRPVYTSDRFVVFEWQFEDLGRMLGPHLDAFDLHAFFDDLTQRSRREGLVIARAEVWEWLQGQVLAEAKQRRLPIAGATQTPTGPRECNHVPRCADEAEHTRKRMADKQRVS